jgi:hypothetical protein
MARNDDDSPGAIGVGCVAIILLIPVGILMTGFVISRLWEWFMVPLGVSAITLPHAYGLTILVGLLSMRGMSSDMKSQEDTSMAKSVFLMVWMAVIMPLLAWFGGWLCHLWMT